MAKASSSSSSSSGEPPLYVQLMSGKKLKLELSIETTTVLQLKQLIEQSSDVPPERQRLLFSGREIPKERDSKTLAKAGIGANGIRYLHMVARPAAAAAAAKKSSSKATVIDLDPTPARASASSRYSHNNCEPPAAAASTTATPTAPLTLLLVFGAAAGLLLALQMLLT
jgi:Ubiquitin family